MANVLTGLFIIAFCLLPFVLAVVFPWAILVPFIIFLAYSLGSKTDVK